MNHIHIGENEWQANSHQSNKVLLSEIANIIHSQLLIDKDTIDSQLQQDSVDVERMVKVVEKLKQRLKDI